MHYFSYEAFLKFIDHDDLLSGFQLNAFNKLLRAAVLSLVWLVSRM